MGAFTVSEVATLAARAGEDTPHAVRPNVGPADRRSRRATMAAFVPWVAAGYVTDTHAMCVGCGDVEPWSRIELGHVLPYAVTMVTYGRNALTAMLPECYVCNRAHGAAAMPFTPRYAWPVAAPARVPGGMVPDPGAGYAQAGSRPGPIPNDEHARKIAQWQR